MWDDAILVSSANAEDLINYGDWKLHSQSYVDEELILTFQKENKGGFLTIIAFPAYFSISDALLDDYGFTYSNKETRKLISEIKLEEIQGNINKSLGKDYAEGPLRAYLIETRNLNLKMACFRKPKIIESLNV